MLLLVVVHGSGKRADLFRGVSCDALCQYQRLALPGLGVVAGCAAAVAAYMLFAHVKVRVQVWQDPFADYAGSGYQIAQALFAIGAGGWFGTGLCQGSPGAIPVVEDFMFAAIAEELGSLFCICPDPDLYELLYHVY